MSFCLTPIVAAKKAVVVPIHAVIISLIFLSSSKQEDRISRNIPAVTIVAACIKAEIGVGLPLRQVVRCVVLLVKIFL